MKEYWLNEDRPSCEYLGQVLRAVEENLAAHAAAVELCDHHAAGLVQEATLGFVREKLEESWLQGMEHGQGRGV